MRFNHLANKLSLINLAVAIGFLAVFCTVTYAGNPSQAPKKELEAWQEALLYSKEHPVIAFALYGRTEKFTAKGNAERIRGFFAGQNIQSQYFLADEQALGSSIAFFLQGVPYGPVGLGKALPTIQKITAHYKEEYGLGP